MQKHRLALEQSMGGGRMVGWFCFMQKEHACTRVSEAGRESAPANLKLILNCLENHHAASGSAFDGRRKQQLFLLLQDLVPPSSEAN